MAPPTTCPFHPPAQGSTPTAPSPPAQGAPIISASSIPGSTTDCHCSFTRQPKATFLRFLFASQCTPTISALSLAKQRRHHHRWLFLPLASQPPTVPWSAGERTVRNNPQKDIPNPTPTTSPTNQDHIVPKSTQTTHLASPLFAFVSSCHIHCSHTLPTLART